MAGEPVELELSAENARFTVSWLDSSSGDLRRAEYPVAGGGKITLASLIANSQRSWVAWLTRAAPNRRS